MKKITLAIFSAVTAIIFSGCICLNDENTAIPEIAVVKAAPGEIVFDGSPDEKFWQKVPANTLLHSRDTDKLPPLEKARVLQDGLEKGSVKFAYSDEYFYIAVIMEDNDLIAITPPGRPTVIYGDYLQIILKPENGNHSWSLFAAPNGMMKAIFNDIHGFSLKMRDKEKFGKIDGYAVAVKVDGTLNKRDGMDKGWTAEIRLPRAAVNQAGNNFAPGEKWRILAARTNYSGYNYAVQQSTFPLLPDYNYDLKEFFARISFQ